MARADAGTVGSSPTEGMDVYCLCCVCVFLCSCAGRGLATSWSPVQGVLQTVLDLVTEVKRKVSWRRPRAELGCRAKGKKMILFIPYGSDRQLKATEVLTKFMQQKSYVLNLDYTHIRIKVSYRVGVKVPVRSRIFSSPSRRDPLCGPPNLLSNGYRGLFPRG
jgi:hypothetical protein